MIQRTADRMQNRMDKLLSKGASESRIGNLGERIASINGTLGTMGQLESSTQVYALVTVGAGEMGGLTYDHGTGVITIGYNGTANFVHEVTHGGQFESGDVAFLQSGGTIGQDVYDEIAAYSAQYAYSPSSVSGLTSSSTVNSFADITASWVQGIVHNGTRPYGPGGIANTGTHPININSTRDDIKRALYRCPGSFNFVSPTLPLKNYPGVYYKR